MIASLFIAWRGVQVARKAFLQQAADEGVDAYISGEISEAQYHIARETQTLYLAAGHHATERYGIQALGKWLSARFDVEISFFDEENPA